jgi:hypothetical protein
VQRHRTGLERDALVVAGRPQKAPLLHDLVQQERGRGVEVDQVDPSPDDVLQLGGELAEAVEGRPSPEASATSTSLSGRSAPRAAEPKT